MKTVPVEFGGTRTIDSETVPLKPHIADFGDGPVRIFPAHRALTGTVEAGAGEQIIITLISIPPGLRPSPLGLCHSYSPDEARSFAAALISAADRLEREAAEQADAALRKAAGK